MKATTILKTLIPSILLLSGLPAADAIAANDTFERSFTVSGPLVLDAENGSGSIKIRSGSGDEATIIGKIQVQRRFLWGKPNNADELIQEVKDNPPIEMDDGRLRVGPVRDRTLGRQSQHQLRDRCSCWNRNSCGDGFGLNLGQRYSGPRRCTYRIG